MFGRFTALRKAAEMGRVRQLVSAVVGVVLFGGLYAQAASLPAKAGAPTDPPQKDEGPTWAGLGFGLGIAADFDIGGTRVVTATTPNNIVRIEDSSSNVNLGFVLETHYFIRDWYFTTNLFCRDVCNMDVATGPFLAIEIGDAVAAKTVGGPIKGYALGWMVGLHHPDSHPNSSWNFGVGLRIDPNGQVLGDGIVANQPLPPNDTLRYKHEPRAGIMLLSSFSW
jgi:hypothetical protein